MIMPHPKLTIIIIVDMTTKLPDFDTEIIMVRVNFYPNPFGPVLTVSPSPVIFDDNLLLFK